MIAADGGAWEGEERRARRPHPHRVDVYVVDDDLTRGEIYAEALREPSFAVRAVAPSREVIDMCANALVVVTMLRMHTMTGVEICKRLHETRPELPVIVLAEHSSSDDVVASLRAGVFDFIRLPMDADALRGSVRRAVAVGDLSQELERLHGSAAHANDGFIGSSPQMRDLKGAIARLASNDVTVQIRGETGSGKELVARALHAASERSHGPFVAINCAAVPAALLESELFGHVRGAYTDAKGNRDGFFVQASGGTLFLDEIGDMPLEMQPKLLRALQEHRVRPLGGSTEISFDTRVISATHHDLDQLVSTGRFRQDLYYRLNVVAIDLPPLRGRQDDIIEIATAVLARAAVRDRRSPLKLSPEVAQRLLAYDWPGNVRELENCMERLVALGRTDAVAVGDLPHRVRDHTPDATIALPKARDIVKLDAFEARYISHVLKLLGGNKSAAADALGIDRRTLYRRLGRHEDPQP